MTFERGERALQLLRWRLDQRADGRARCAGRPELERARGVDELGPKALGRRDEVEASGTLDALVASAARHSRRSIVLSNYYRGELAELRRVSIGPDLVFGKLWRETGCGDVINGLLRDRRFGFDVERVIYVATLHRLMVSGSDRHASRWRHNFRIPGTEDIKLDHSYLAMAWLGEEIGDGRFTTDAIEEQLYRYRHMIQWRNPS